MESQTFPLSMKQLARLLLLVAATFCSFAWAQGEAVYKSNTSAANSTAAEATKKTAATLNSERLNEIEKLRRQLDENRNNLAGQLLNLNATLDRQLETTINQKLNALNTLDLVYLQQISQLKRNTELATDQERLQKEVQTLTHSLNLPVDQLTFTNLENTRHELTAEREEKARLEWSMAGLRAAITDHVKYLEERESARRKIRETIDNNSAPEDQLNLAESLKLAELESDLAKQTLAVKELENTNNDVGIEVARLKGEILAARLAYLAKRAVISSSDLSQQLNLLEDKEKQLRKQIETVKPKLALCERSYQESIKRAASSQPLDGSFSDEQETYRLCRETMQNDLNIYSELLYLIPTQKENWQKRYKFYHHELALPAIRAWYRELTNLNIEIDNRIRTQNSKLNQLRALLAKVNTRMDALPEQSTSSLRWLKDQQNYLQKSFNSHIDHVDELQAIQRFTEYCREDIAATAEATSWSDVYKAIIGGLVAFWNYELFNIDDKPITVRKIIVAIVLFVFAFWLARRFSERVAQRVLPRFGLKTGETAAFQSLIFYVLLIFFTLFVLELVHVPLTIFTILGGAVAIGVGFGSQNIMNNFISGIILLIERPIRVGDLVEIEGQQGRVQQIGARSTRIITGDNIDLVVPNSFFLEKSVTNWTLSDEKARTSVNVGVAYGSDPEVVKDLLVQAAKTCAHVKHFPEPYATLTEFGDNSLVFSVYFWLTMSATNNSLVARSDVRCAIEKLFQEKDIAIPFPQRETLLKTDSPLDVRVATNGQ